MVFNQSKKMAFFAFMAGFSLLFACQKKTETPVAPIIIVAPLEYIKDVATFPFGAALDPTRLRTDGSYSGVVKREHSSITVENAQKWATIHPSKDVFKFNDADYIVDWAVQNNKRAHGHTLLWHSSNPDWLKNFQGDSAAWENLMKTHIQTVVGHFKGRVKSWDVVNEAFENNGSLRLRGISKAEDGSIWAQKLGEDYIARAFKYAHETDPNALLFYNDFGQEGNAAKTKAIIEMANDLKKRGIPIHGLGLQFHIGVSQTDANLETAIQQLAQTGLLIHISELDVLVSDWQKNDKLQYTETLQNKQSAKYKFIAQTYRRLVPKNQQHGITTWNVGDSDSWVTNYLQYTDWPLLFDKNYERKKAYYGFLEGLK